MIHKLKREYNNKINIYVNNLQLMGFDLNDEIT